MWTARMSEAGLSLETRIRRTYSCYFGGVVGIELAYGSIGFVHGLDALDYVGEVFCKLLCALGVYSHV